MDQLLRMIRDDVLTKRLLERRIAENIARARLKGASWRAISRKTEVPVTTARDQAKPFLTPST